MTNESVKADEVLHETVMPEKQMSVFVKAWWTFRRTYGWYSTGTEVVQMRLGWLLQSWMGLSSGPPAIAVTMYTYTAGRSTFARLQNQ